METFQYTAATTAAAFHVALVAHVTNADAVRVAVLEGTLQAAVINADKVVSLFTLQTAVYRAALSFASGTAKTRSIYAETLYNLSPSKQIKVAFDTFGIPRDEQLPSLLLVVIGDRQEAENALSTLQGEIMPVKSLDTVSPDKLASLAKLYDVSAVAADELEGAVITKLALKHAR